MKTQYVAAAVLSALILNPLPAGAEGKDGVAAVGNGKEVLLAALTVCLPYIGFPRTLNALSCINEVLPEAKQ